MRVTPRRLLRLGAEIVLFIALALLLEWFMTRDAPRGPSPKLVAVLADGRAFDLDSLRGRPALVYFWANWCPVCAAQGPGIDGLLKEYPGITVAMRSGGARDIQAHLAREGFAWPTIVDDDGEIARVWGVSGVPAVYVLDALGGIRFVTRGFSTGYGLRARLWWAEHI